MTPEQWLSVSMLLLVATNLATLVYALRARNEASSGNHGAAAGESGAASRPPSAAGDADDGTVTCTECGTSNERGYRYCRNCTAELPGVRIGGAPASGLGNGSFE